MPDYERVKRILRLIHLVRRHKKVERIASEEIHDLEYHSGTGMLTWKARYERFEADLNGGYIVGAVEVSFGYSFSSRKVHVMDLEIDNVQPKKTVILPSAGEKEKKALASKLERAIRKIFDDVLEKATK
jgi:hypothetical protein